MKSRRWLWLLLLIPLVAGLARVRLDTDIFALLPAELPIVRGLKLHEQHFAGVRELIITVRSPEAERTEAVARALAERLRGQTSLVARVLWQPPFAEQPGHTAELLASLWLNQKPEDFAALVSRLSPTNLPATLQATREELTASLSPTSLGSLGYDPLGLTQLPETAAGGRDTLFAKGQQGFASHDGTFRVVFVQPAMELSDYRACARWFREVRDFVARSQSEQGWGVAIRFTGGPAFVTEAATGMERDMKSSVASTVVLIALLFWWAHRRWRPLFCLMAALGIIVLGTMAAGGLLFGGLNVVSFGFAAILLGLAVDYGLLLYQEALACPQLSAVEIRRRVGPSIWWAALTTAGAFLMLHFGGLPGLSQLGSLVGVGILLAAAVMLQVFLPPVLGGAAAKVSKVKSEPAATPRTPAKPLVIWGITLAVVVAALAMLWHAAPRIDHGTKPLEPAHSKAQPALAELQKELSESEDPVWFLLSGPDEQSVAAQLAAADRVLARAVSNQLLRGYTLPSALWPQPDSQRSNLPFAVQLAERQSELRAVASNAGFTSNSMALAESVFAVWQRAAHSAEVFWPTNESCRWLFGKFSARTPNGWLALGVVNPAVAGQVPRLNAPPFSEVPGALWASMPMLGESLLNHVAPRMGWLTAAMLCALVLCLWLAFRGWREVGLSFATFGLSLLLLLAIMGLAGWKWNLMNLTVLPLLLGAGVDYSIHIQLALRRHAGDAAAMRRVTGKAVFLGAATTVVGFGSLCWSSNAGLASLGAVCATGMACVFIVAVTLLPGWWQTCAGDQRITAVAAKPQANVGQAAPSSFYRVEIWRLGLAFARVMPRRCLERLCQWIAGLYWLAHRQRRRVAIQNLLPLCSDDRLKARRAARKLFDQFALKLADLWRWEGGAPWDSGVLTAMEGWERFEAARARGRGVLLVTPHLGNWELGGTIMIGRGVQLLVLTLEEPSPQLTELRCASRLQRDIETLVVGRDAFAFIEIIKRLQAGATVALLMDRPPSPSAVTVEFCGRPFLASVAAAELARASGCAVVGVYVLRNETGYTSIVLPEFQYDRRALGTREARAQFTQEILRAFEPIIRQHPDQWYHFVPIWPQPESPCSPAVAPLPPS